MRALSRVSIEEVRATTYKSRDAWWTVLLVDPLASRLVRLAAPYRWITPNRLTVTAFLLGVAAAACFAVADYPWLVAGAALFHLSFLVDCMDGKIARLKGMGSVFGAWLDYVIDRLRILVCAIGLMGGQYVATGRPIYLVVGAGVVFLDLFRYLNALQIEKSNREMRDPLLAVERPRSEDSAAEARAAGAPATEPLAVPPVGNDDALAGLYRESLSRIRGFAAVRGLLTGHRIRSHLFSGIEFQMAVFIVGPVTAAVIAVSVVAGILLLAFEAVVTAKFWLATRAFTRKMDALAPPQPVPAQAPGELPAETSSRRQRGDRREAGRDQASGTHQAKAGTPVSC